MNRNEKTVAGNDGLVNFNERFDSTPRSVEMQQVFNFGGLPKLTTTTATGQNADELPFRFTGLRLVCDECAAPLWLYGENFIDSYTDGRANILRCLCDLCADALDLEVAK
jgi:hypothetical protein